MLRGSLLVVIVVACGSRQPAPPPPPPDSGSTGNVVVTSPEPPADAAPPGPLDRDLDRLAERSVALYGEIVVVFGAARENCAAAATKLDELTRTYADVIAANAKVLHEGREMQLKIALRRFDAQFHKSANAIMQSRTIAACFQDAAFAKSLEGLVGPRP